MEARLPQLPLRLLLLGTAALTVSALETADLVALCGRTWQGDGLLLRSHSESRRFYFVAPDTDCQLWVQAAAPGHRIRFQFRFFLVYSLTPASPVSPAPSVSSPEPADPCAPGSFLQFYEGSPQALGAPLCGLTIPAPVASSGPSLGLRLVTRGRQPRVDFVGEVTSFRSGPCGAYFRCGNGRCIPPSLVCDHWGMDNCGDGSDQSSQPPADCRGPSLVPGQTGSTDAGASKPPTLLLPLGSAGPLWTAAERSPPAGRDPAQRNATLEGPQLRGVAVASSLLLASAGLFLGFLWCCCSPGRLAWQRQSGAHDLRPSCSAACTTCYTYPCQVAPGGLRPSGPTFQHQGGHP
ncbi:low-density lipoprotein receptor class A domain-containing protein 2 [Lemur catta]|uniref:low-density lipoprotein receptor class A domain-containing protein 2 n=1 Tax=Lemur catta TaxID=9447 RepID=UPI001E26E357|nr:low-density lipoprotein receptor class A domain-containing protein 2 [Lemur catta]